VVAAARPVRGVTGVGAHVGGVPVEELLPTAAGVVTALGLARAWVAVQARRVGRRGPRA
jgi:hypothetical protein